MYSLSVNEEPRTQFVTAVNDGSLRSMELLINFKCLIVRQLPKMQKEHIIRLIFDPRHSSILLIEGSRNIIGGICFRVFEELSVAEIAFLVVKAEEQVKGFGTKLMDQLKGTILMT